MGAGNRLAQRVDQFSRKGRFVHTLKQRGGERRAGVFAVDQQRSVGQFVRAFQHPLLGRHLVITGQAAVGILQRQCQPQVEPVTVDFPQRNGRAFGCSIRLRRSGRGRHRGRGGGLVNFPPHQLRLILPVEPGKHPAHNRQAFGQGRGHGVGCAQQHKAGGRGRPCTPPEPPGAGPLGRRGLHRTEYPAAQPVRLAFSQRVGRQVHCLHLLPESVLLFVHRKYPSSCRWRRSRSRPRLSRVFTACSVRPSAAAISRLGCNR